MKILLVEDDKSLFEQLKKRTRTLGFASVWY